MNVKLLQNFIFFKFLINVSMIPKVLVSFLYPKVEQNVYFPVLSKPISLMPR